MTEKLPTALSNPDSIARPARVQTFVPEPEARDVVLIDEADPRAVINLLPDSFREAVKDLAFERPEYLNQDERTLARLYREQRDAGLITKDAAVMGPMENRLRVAFWLEYNRAQDNRAKMRLENICAGLCTRAYFENEILRRKTKLAWVLTPPISYTNAMEEALIYGVEKIRDILDVELKDSKGQVNVKAAEVLLKTIQFLDQRVKGAIVQKVDTRSLVVHANTDSKPKGSEPVTLESVQKELASLEQKTQELMSGRTAPRASASGGRPSSPLEHHEPIEVVGVEVTGDATK